ncbi:hypothetical protein KNE206_54210 [Kitasatospora sp. NE20-6]
MARGVGAACAVASSSWTRRWRRYWGAPPEALAGWEPWTLAVAVLLPVVVAVHGLSGLRRPASTKAPAAVPGGAGTAADGRPGTGSDGGWGEAPRGRSCGSRT